MLADTTLREMCNRAKQWLKADGLDGPRVTRANAINEDHMALDILDLLGELTVLRALLDASESRKDMLAAHLWLSEQAVPMARTLTERVKSLAASRQNLAKCLARLQPLLSVLRDWSWEEIEKDGVLPRELPVELRVIQAFAAVERAEKEASRG